MRAPTRLTRNRGLGRRTTLATLCAASALGILAATIPVSAASTSGKQLVVKSPDGLAAFSRLGTHSWQISLATPPATMIELYLQSTIRSKSLHLGFRTGADPAASRWTQTISGFSNLHRCGDVLSYAAQTNLTDDDGFESDSNWIGLNKTCRVYAHVDAGVPVSVARVDAKHLQVTGTDIEGANRFSKVTVGAGSAGRVTLRKVRGQLTSGQSWIRTVSGFHGLKRCSTVTVTFANYGTATLRPGCNGLLATPPRSVSASQTGATTVQVAWKPPKNDGGRRVTKYFVSDTYNGVNKYCSAAHNSCVLKYGSDESPEKGRIQVAAVNKVGQSGYSALTHVTTTPAA